MGKFTARLTRPAGIPFSSEKQEDKFKLTLSGHAPFRIISPLADPWGHVWDISERDLYAKRDGGKQKNGHRWVLTPATSEPTHLVEFYLSIGKCLVLKSRDANISHVCITNHARGNSWLAAIVSEIFEETL